MHLYMYVYWIQGIDFMILLQCVKKNCDKTNYFHPLPITSSSMYSCVLCVPTELLLWIMLLMESVFNETKGVCFLSAEL